MVLRQLQAIVTNLPPAMPANNNLSVCCIIPISIFEYTDPGWDCRLRQSRFYAFRRRKVFVAATAFPILWQGYEVEWYCTQGYTVSTVPGEPNHNHNGIIQAVGV